MLSTAPPTAVLCLSTRPASPTIAEHGFLVWCIQAYSTLLCMFVYVYRRQRRNHSKPARLFRRQGSLRDCLTFLGSAKHQYHNYVPQQCFLGHFGCVGYPNRAVPTVRTGVCHPSRLPGADFHEQDGKGENSNHSTSESW
jgi:hypothetical protein